MKPTKSVKLVLLTLFGAVVTVGATAGVVIAAPAKPDYSLSSAPASQSIQQGQTASYTIQIAGTNGFTGAVTLSASGLPSGATASFSSVTPALSSNSPTVTSTMTVVTSRSTAVGTSSITVTGTSGSAKRSVTVGLTVNYALAGSFALSVSPSAVTVAPGSTAVYTVTVSRTAPFTGAVTLATSGGWPTGTSGSFSPDPVTGTSSTLQLTTSASGTPSGSYTMNLIGSYTDPSSGQVSNQYAQAQLVVSASSATRAFSIQGGPSDILTPGRTPSPLNLQITNPNNQALSITNLSVTVNGTSNSGCAASNFAVRQYSGTYPVNVPAGAQGVALTSLGVPAASLPTVQLQNLSTNQDACKGVTVNLSYSGS